MAPTRRNKNAGRVVVPDGPFSCHNEHWLESLGAATFACTLPDKCAPDKCAFRVVCLHTHGGIRCPLQALARGEPLIQLLSELIGVPGERIIPVAKFAAGIDRGTPGVRRLASGRIESGATSAMIAHPLHGHAAPLRSLQSASPARPGSGEAGTPYGLRQISGPTISPAISHVSAASNASGVSHGWGRPRAATNRDRASSSVGTVAAVLLCGLVLAPGRALRLVSMDWENVTVICSCGDMGLPRGESQAQTPSRGSNRRGWSGAAGPPCAIQSCRSRRHKTATRQSPRLPP